MNFLAAGYLLEDIKSDLDRGNVAAAVARLAEVVRINPHDFYGTGPIPTASRKAAARLARSVRKKASEPGRGQWWHQHLKAGMYAAAGARKKARETFRKAHKHTIMAPAAEAAPEPSTGQHMKPMGRHAEPMKIKFKSLLKGWKEHREAGGETSPEALGGFLHRHFGHRKFDHAKVMKIAMKAHGLDKESARRVADHYAVMNKGKKS